MRSLRILAALVAALLAGGEVARRAVAGGALPGALDDLAMAAVLAWAAWRSGSAGAPPLLAAWSGFCGYALVLLTLNAGAGTGKWHYVAALAAMLALGLWAARRAMQLLGAR